MKGIHKNGKWVTVLTTDGYFLHIRSMDHLVDPEKVAIKLNHCLIRVSPVRILKNEKGPMD